MRDDVEVSAVLEVSSAQTQHGGGPRPVTASMHALVRDAPIRSAQLRQGRTHSNDASWRVETCRRVEAVRSQGKCSVASRVRHGVPRRSRAHADPGVDFQSPQVSDAGEEEQFELRARMVLDACHKCEGSSFLPSD